MNASGLDDRSSVACLLGARGLSKSFGGARALRDVSFEVCAGEVHVLAGANGAGKSTLIKILSGAITEYDGEVRIGDRRARFRGPLDAQRAGIATIHQELSLVGAMSVVDNLFLGRERVSRLGFVRAGAERAEAAAILASMGLAVDPDQRVEELPLATQQLVEIARALAREARVFIMDEPTSALVESEAERLFAGIRRLRAQGCGVVYITHKLDEIDALADRITVLRDGACAGTALPSELGRDALVAWMIGRAVERKAPASRRTNDQPALTVEGLSLRSASDPARLDVQEVSFTLRRGEILAVTGLRGSGATELLHGLFDGGGLVSGSVRIGDRPFAIESPGRAIAQGLLLLPADRKGAGIVPERSILENITLGALDRHSHLGWLRLAAERAAASQIAREVLPASIDLDAAAGTLSGGGQQKVMVARALLTAPEVLLLDEPTRGVDVAAKAEIHELIRRAADQGISIVVTSSEVDEILALADRILVMRSGRIAAEFDRARATEEQIVRASVGQEA